MSDLNTKLSRYVEELTPPAVAPLPLEPQWRLATPRRRRLWPLAASVALTAAVVLGMAFVRADLFDASDEVATSPGDLVGSWNISGVGDVYQPPRPPTSNHPQPTLELVADGTWEASLDCNVGPITGAWNLEPSGAFVASASTVVPQACISDLTLQALLAAPIPQPEGPNLKLVAGSATDLLLTPVPGPDDPVAVISEYGTGRGYLALSLPVGKQCDERVTRVQQPSATELVVVVDLGDRGCAGSDVTAEFGHALRKLPDPTQPTTVHLYGDGTEPIDLTAAWDSR
ncbi:MAG: hypothetical protein ACJ74E_07255 [Actinomycetes bacterium]